MNFFVCSDEDSDKDTSSSTTGYPSESTIIETRSGDKSGHNSKNR